MRRHSKEILLQAILFQAVFLGPLSSRALSETPVVPDTDPAKAAELEAKAAEEVESVRNRYWARGEEADMGVVQNRTFSKKRRLEFGFFGGVLSTDPFLSVQTAGARVGYHFSETFALHVMGWHSFVSPSTALETFEETIGATTNNNPPRNYAGAEGTASLIYGKLSLLGASILYYDMHLLAGAGLTSTESGNYFTPHLGIGQQIFLNQTLALRVDYRAQFYRETIIEKVITPRLGEVVGQRNNWSHSFQLGLSLYW
jgi:outer membrane beta-barrel protein